MQNHLRFPGVPTWNNHAMSHYYHRYPTALPSPWVMYQCQGPMPPSAYPNLPCGPSPPRSPETGTQRSPRPAATDQRSSPPEQVIQPPPPPAALPLNPNNVAFIPYGHPRQLTGIPLYHYPYASPCLQGGVVWQRSHPVYRPLPVCPTRKRTVPRDPGIGAPQPLPHQSQSNEEKCFSKKNKIDPEVNEGIGINRQTLEAAKRERDNWEEQIDSELQKLLEGDLSPRASTSTQMPSTSSVEEREDGNKNIVEGNSHELHTSTNTESASTSTAEESVFYYPLFKSKYQSAQGISTIANNRQGPEVHEDYFINLPSTSTLQIPRAPTTAVITEISDDEDIAVEEISPGNEDQNDSKHAEGDVDADVLIGLYEKLKKYVPNAKQLKNMGYPQVFQGDTRIAFVFKQEIRLPSRIKLNKNKKNDLGSTEKICVRCGETFYVKGCNYLTTESCRYHWGKFQVSEDYLMLRTCCNGKSMSVGCTTAKLHVWSGIDDGINRLKGFVQPKPSLRKGSKSCEQIFSVDCEMIYTKAGMEVARVVLVNIHGDLVYSALVQPQHEVIDYNTRFSGISLMDYTKCTPRPFHDVQRDLLKYIKPDTIIIGHSLDNDLRVLKIIHPLVVDTAIIYPHRGGFPLRRSLRDLAQEFLGKTIHSKDSSHDPVEDAKTALALVLYKVKLDDLVSKSK